MRPRPAVLSPAALAALALCAAPNRAAAAAAERTSITGPDSVLTLTSRAPTGQRGHWFVAFREEITPEAGPNRVEGRSLKGAADVDCGGAQFQVAKLDVFEGPNFTGALLLDVGKRVEWRSPEPGTTMARVLAATCGKTTVQARGPAAGVRLAELDPPAPPSAPSTPPPPAQPPDPAETVAPAAGGGFYAQLGALSSAEAARQAWDRLKRAAPGVLDDHRRRLAMATVQGRRVYRVLAGGFATKAEAERVCKALADRSAQCFVRPGDAI